MLLDKLCVWHAPQQLVRIICFPTTCTYHMLRSKLYVSYAPLQIVCIICSPTTWTHHMLPTTRTCHMLPDNAYASYAPKQLANPTFCIYHMKPTHVYVSICPAASCTYHMVSKCFYAISAPTTCMCYHMGPNNLQVSSAKQLECIICNPATYIYSALSIYRGHVSLKISRTTPHSSPVRARYGVPFENAKSGQSRIIVNVVLCVLSCYRWPRYIESL